LLIKEEKKAYFCQLSFLGPIFAKIENLNQRKSGNNFQQKGNYFYAEI
jgi:hypothetical protein